MKVSMWFGIALVLAGAVAADPASSGPVDLLIRNGMVLDGLGHPAVRADVMVDDGRIGLVGDAGRSVRAARTIDAAGRIVAPGFIDLHRYGDPQAILAFEDFLNAGVTTITLGQDGEHPAPDDLGVWLDQVGAAGVGVNLAMLVGHGTLRMQAGIGARAVPDIAGFEVLRSRLEAGLERAFGLSLGPDRPSDPQPGELELRALARIAGTHDRVVMVRLRAGDESALERSLDQVIRLGSQARIHIAGLESIGGGGQLRVEEIPRKLDMARLQGVRITADLPPSAAGASRAASVAIDAALQNRLLADPYVAISSGVGPAGGPPGGYRAFAWAIEEQVRSKRLLDLPEAVRKMTSLPASILGIKDRGRIEPGLAADLVIFDPARVRVQETDADLAGRVQGFDVVIVNGRVARDAGVLAAGLHGAVLRP